MSRNSKVHNSAPAADFELLKKLFDLQIKTKIDPRLIACELQAITDGKLVRINGFSQFRQTDTFIRNMAQEVFAGMPLDFNLRVITRAHPLAFHEVICVAAPLYRQALVKKEDLLTEALYGSVIRTYFSRDGFTFAQHPDGYVGYVPSQHLKKTTIARYLRWKNGKCAVAKVPLALNGFIIPPTARLIKEYSSVQLPDGKWHRVRKCDVNIKEPASLAFKESVLEAAEVFRNTPYLWGGKTQEGIDCSGFVQTLAYHEGIMLPRDASMQANMGEIVGYLPKFADLLPGDLLFFMNDQAYVFHVGIYLGNYTYIHSSGSKNVVKSSLRPGDPNYLSRYGRTFVFARRVHS
ncbi:MAG: NlpC/P60 family protein [Candidatus Sumerlaeaceae bacterium]